MTRPFFTPTFTEKALALKESQPTFQMLQQAGAYLSEGFHSVVFNVDDHWVIRASLRKDDGWRAITRISAGMRERLRLPYVLHTWVDTCRAPLTEEQIAALEIGYGHKYLHNDDIEISIVERLNPLVFGTDYHKAPTSRRRRRPAFPYPGVHWLLSFSHPCSVVVPDAIRAHRVMMRLGLVRNPNLDVNYGNIMKRENGDYILSDPFGVQLLPEWRENNGITL